MRGAFWVRDLHSLSLASVPTDRMEMVSRDPAWTAHGVDGVTSATVMPCGYLP